jgi:hypothetical protein
MVLAPVYKGFPGDYLAGVMGGGYAQYFKRYWERYAKQREEFRWQVGD